MAEKTISKHLINLDNQFSTSSPILQKASKTFHHLDQLEYDLGLINKEDTTARKTSWWPIVSLIGGFSTAKSDFVNRYLGTNIHTSHHKFTVHQFTPQETEATLPGTALDADHRLPFYQISHKIEQIAVGEGEKVNAYLELKTVHSERLKGKLFIDTPVLNASPKTSVVPALTQHVLQLSDLILVFTDLFEAAPELIEDTIKEIIAQQDTNKFLFVIDHSEITIDADKKGGIIHLWEQKLAALGIYTGQFIVLSDESKSNDDTSLVDIDQRLANIENDRSYRVIYSLEKSIRDIHDVYFPEVQSSLETWKDRVNMSTFIVLGFIVTLIVAAEISFGIIDLFLDPIIGPILLLILIAIMLPLHIIMAKVHAKFIMNTLQERQRTLNLNENLTGLFAKSLSFWRIVLPTTEPVGKNKKTRKKCDDLIEKTKDTVQSLNDQFNHSQEDDTNSLPDRVNPFDQQ